MSTAVVNPEREDARLALADQLFRAPYSQLLRYGIGSYRDITKLDKIGVPVWISTRPLARTISVNAGKSLDWLLAFAGAITEAMEFWASENPWGQSTIASHAELQEAKEHELLAFRELPLAKDNICDANMQLSWEKVECINRAGSSAWMPSDCVWLVQRQPTQFVNFHCTSSGVASGALDADAVLSGLYEVIERDGWALHRCYLQATGQWPPKIPTVGLPDELERIAWAMQKADLYPFVFDITTSLGIPVFGCMLLDRSVSGDGTFGGYGCSLNPVQAAKRAMLESCQSRACYISGARDDMFRRDFLLLKQAQLRKAITTAEALPAAAANWDEFAKVYGNPTFASVSQELEQLLDRLKASGITKLYRRTLAEETFGKSKVTIVRVIAPQLEGVPMDSWQSNGRANAYVRKRLHEHAGI
jgi:YcaO-like protein with predicted kinase domain